MSTAIIPDTEPVAQTTLFPPESAEHLLDLMFKDMGLAPASFQPTTFWSAHIPEIIQDIALLGIDNFQLHPSAHHLYAGPTVDHKAKRDYERFQLEDRELPPLLNAFSQSLIGRPWELFEADGRRFSLGALNYLRALAFLKQTVDTTKIHSVLEIGGGFGLLGEILLTSASGPYFYINVDIPPVAAVATYYLTQLFGESVASYAVTRESELITLDQLKEKYRALLLCPWQLPKTYGTVDLAVNFISFQEMEPEVVKNYASHISRLSPKWLLLRNSRHGKSGTLKPVTRETVLEAFAGYKLLAHDSERFGDTYGDFESEVMILEAL